MNDMRAMLAAPVAEPVTPAAAAEPAARTAPDSERETIAEVSATAVEKAATEAAAAAETVPPGVQKRIDKAVKAQREAERHAEELEAQLAEKTESRPAPAKTPAAEPAPVPVVHPGKPDATKFRTYEEYNEALLDWKIAASKAADARVEAARKGADAQAAKGVAWNERVEAAKAVHADYEEVLAEAGTMKISEAMHHAIFESDRGPEIAYFLATHPEDAARIEKLPPFSAAAAIGEIKAALPAAKTATSETPAAKKLPKPASQVGGGHAPVEVDLNSCDMATFKREFAKRHKA